MAVAGLAGGAALLAVGEPGPAAALLLAGVATLPFISIRVVVDGDGVRVIYWRLPWPASRIPLARITGASVIDLRPLKWGGWGYRGSLRLFRKAAVVLRAGEALRLDLVGHGLFVITVDGAADGAGWLTGHLGSAAA
jgi:hypothetical protein